MLHLIAEFKARPGVEDELREATLAVVAPSRAEAGNIRFDLRENADAPGHFFIVECWTDRAALERHFAEPYLVDLVEKHKRLLDGPLVLHELTPIED